MSTSVALEPAANTDRFYTVIKSMNNFDKMEVNGVILTILSPTPREECFRGIYFRTLGNVETLLQLNKSKDVQAIVMLARTLFELAVDIRLLEKIPNGWIKMTAFSDYEKLRCAKKVLDFKTKNPDADIDSTTLNAFVARNEKKVEGFKTSLWPNVKNPNHWSGLTFSQRVTLLKSPFDQIYAVDYPRLSWYVHSGLTGVMNMQAVTFVHMCAYGFHIAATAYGEALLSVIREFKILKANENIEQKLHVAKMLPFTDSPEQVDLLTRSIQ